MEPTEADCPRQWVSGQTFDTYPGYIEKVCDLCGAIKTEQIPETVTNEEKHERS